MVSIGFPDALSLAQTIEIVGTMSSDQETRVLNDLDEKFHNMAMLAMVMCYAYTLACGCS
jgi:hypothetical protein